MCQKIEQIVNNVYLFSCFINFTKYAEKANQDNTEYYSNIITNDYYFHDVSVNFIFKKRVLSLYLFQKNQ